jgi:transcriptional regulator with XRE-family HTH domain
MFKALTPPQLKILGERLSFLRAREKVSAAIVARDALGYESGHVAVTRLERAVVAAPKNNHLEALAKYYGVELKSLLTPVTKEEQESLQAASSVTVQKTQLVRVAPEEKMTPLPRYKSFGPRIQWAREQALKTPEELASIIRENGALVTSTDVRAWEAESKEPNPIQWRALDLSLKHAPDWLRTGKLETASTKVRSPFLMTNMWI